uniref:Histone H4 n=1 Tax=Clandestinovirus TaxID=2831644 RepID=A0A8F8KRN3_9VIRU|nr:histone H4 [Clandestinovirus]
MPANNKSAAAKTTTKSKKTTQKGSGNVRNLRRRSENTVDHLKSVLPRARVSSKLAPRAGNRRVKSSVYPLLKAFVDNIVKDHCERARIVSTHNGRMTIQGKDIVLAHRTTGGRFYYA